MTLYEDAERCAVGRRAAVRQVEEPGIRRVRRGRGFSYLDSEKKAVAAEVRARIESLAIPPAWRDVWICLYEDGHLLAIGEDERGRRQYRYHDDWRTFRDLLNFYRLVDVGPRLPKVARRWNGNCAGAASTGTRCSLRCCASSTPAGCASAARRMRRRTRATA